MNRRFYKKKPAAIAIDDSLSDTYKTLISSNSYLGNRGYTIPRELLSKADEEFLRKDLFVKPVILGPAMGQTVDEAYPVYRESAKKFYIPRFYGNRRYGLPALHKISPGSDIAVEFGKPLRDYQNKIVGIYMNHVYGEEFASLDIGQNGAKHDVTNHDVTEHVGNGGILEVPCGAGKTVMALKIISLLKKKTLIIVHKEFLMNQWIERIAEFLPMAKVGKIQGPTFEVAGNDIVIGMVQSLYDKDYGQDAFSEFGLTIIDEVHRIGSEQFSRTLLKIVTPYMLGISATVDRKDQLTKVLYMFIGDKIYTEQRSSDDAVCVRAIEYLSSDPVFNAVEYDFKGMTKYSTMITKLCAFGPRSDFIVRTIKDLIDENPHNQIMVLAHNRSLLTYLHEAIQHRQIASVGFYVGGMKQAKLQATELMQVVLATYAMAAEALDIKTLSTLVMVTPKTDIIQSVGRILRVKHANPIVVDIVDSHEVFQNQWKQRRQFYKRCNYRIRQIDSKRYVGMSIDWAADMTWKRLYEPKSASDTSADTGADTGVGTGVGTDEKPAGKCLISLEGLDL